MSVSENLKVSSLTLDSQRLTQVLVNIISNSLKFTDNGFINVNASIDEKELQITCLDSGCGISEEN